MGLVDGVEGVSEVFNRWPAAAVGPGEGDDVEAGGIIEKAMALEVGRGETGEATLLREIDRLGGMALFAAFPCLHLDEDDRASVDGNQVKFAQTGADAAANDPKAASPEIAGGKGLAPLAERAGPDQGSKPVDCLAERFHGRRGSKVRGAASAHALQGRRARALAARESY